MSSDLKAAVETLYRGTDEARRNEANQWLMSFSKTAEAWEGARALLSDPAEDVQYFGANMFFVKVRSEWHGMPEEAKASVYSGLQQLVLQLASHEGGGWHRLSAAGKRLCLTLAAAAVRSGSTADNFVREALSMCTATGAPVAVELLTALPQEVLDHEAQVCVIPWGLTRTNTPLCPGPSPDLDPGHELGPASEPSPHATGAGGRGRAHLRRGAPRDACIAAAGAVVATAMAWQV